MTDGAKLRAFARSVSMAEENGSVRAALGDLDARLDHWRQTLVALCRILSVSAAGFPPDEVRRSAQAVAQALREAGAENVEVLEIPGAQPYVYGEWLHQPGASRRAIQPHETGARRGSLRHAREPNPAIGRERTMMHWRLVGGGKMGEAETASAP